MTIFGSILINTYQNICFSTNEYGELTMTFLPGHSGNPAGRPRGSRNKKTLALEALLDEESEALMRRVIGLAKMGDDVAMRLLFARMLPPRRDRPVPLELPRIESEADARRASGDVIEALSAGEITPREAEQVLRVIAGAAVVMQASELGSRIRSLQEQVAQISAERAQRQITAPA
jgi:uncharacterized protein DUF5681